MDSTMLVASLCRSNATWSIACRVSAGALEKSMPAESRAVFSQRRSFDLVVMLDWDTTQAKFTPGSRLYTLRTILNKVSAPRKKSNCCEWSLNL
jgi:hypothetical protein